MTPPGSREERPAFAFVDAHIHFWDTACLAYPWLAHVPSLPERADAFRFGEVVNQLPGNAIVRAVVAVQAECDPNQAETEVSWLLEQRALGAPVAAIVAYAPLEEPGAAEVLDRYASLPIVKGVRRNIQDEAAGFCRQLTMGVRSLAHYGLSFDLCVREHQLREVIELVDAARDAWFVLDHLGKPSVGSPHWANWAAAISDLAERPNVYCKLSGLGTEALGNWSIADVAPYVLHAMEVFGADRVMFGSDWPICTAAGSYGGWLDTILSIVPPEFHDPVFVQNASAFYRLDQG